MPLNNPEYVNTDVLVIGSGGAGLRAAIAARERGVAVLLVSKSLIGLGNNTAISIGSIAAATGEPDSRDNPEIHALDTVNGGRFINDRGLVSRMTELAPAEVVQLEKYGVIFPQENGKRIIGLGAGHTYPRNVRGDKYLGTSYTLPLKTYAAKLGVDFKERLFVTRLMLAKNRIAGVVGFDPNGRLFVFQASSIVLAAGGLGHLYQYSDNAAGTTGDGYALAYQAGLPLRDMEFVQFYPTSVAGVRMINYEALVLNAGAKLTNALGEDIFLRYGMTSSLNKTRDRATRAVFQEILEGRGKEEGVIIDLRPVPETNLQKFRYLLPPGAAKNKEIIVTPTCQFHMGGCVVDTETRTGVTGLFAAGEVAGGVQGANGLGSNAFAATFSFGALAGKNAALFALNNTPPAINAGGIKMEKQRLESLFGKADIEVAHLASVLRATMWSKAGIIRDEKGLKGALDKFREISLELNGAKVSDMKGLMRRLELDNMLLIGEIVIKAALERKESRGAHFRADYPVEDEKWLVSLSVTKNNGRPLIEKNPIQI